MTAAAQPNYWEVPHEQQRVQVAPQKSRTTYQRTGLLGKLESAVNSATNTALNVSRKAGTQLDYLIHQNITKESQQRWWTFGISDTLLGEFPCKCISGNKSVKGYLLVSYQYVCFLSQSTNSNDFIRVAIPFASVMEGRACDVVSTGKGIIPTFKAVNPASTSNPISQKKGIQIYTTDNFVHQFYGFKLQFYTVNQTLQRSIQMNRHKYSQSPSYPSNPQTQPAPRTAVPPSFTQPQSAPLYPSTQSAAPITSSPSPYNQATRSVPSSQIPQQSTISQTQNSNVNNIRTSSSGLYPVLERPTIIPAKKESVRPLTFAELQALQAQ